MDESKIIVGAKRIINHWGIEAIDLFYLMVNHELRVLDQDSNHIGIDEVFENYINDEKFDINSLTYSLSDFKRIDNEFGQQFELKRKELMRGREWTEKAGHTEIEIYNFITVHGLEFVDSLGISMDDFWLLRYFSNSRFKMADLLFRMSDVEALENKIEIPGKKPLPVKKKPGRWSEEQRTKCREVAKKIWGQDPSITIQEMTERAELFEFTRRKDGKLFGDKIIRDWIKDLCPNRKPGRRPKREQA
jgi:hypothetical protein